MVKPKEKEQTAKIKALRKELEEKIEEQLPSEMADGKIRVEVKKVDEAEALDPVRAKQIVEALLFASSKPLTITDIRKTISSLSAGEVRRMIMELKAEYDEQGRSFEVIEIANGYELASRKDFAPWIMKVELQKKAKQVTQSALETLSILAYKQPITRAEVEELRGVDVSGVMSTLTERGLIRIVGKKEVPGRPFLYGTTDKFLEHFGLGTLRDLPSIDEIRSLVESSVNRNDLIGTSNVVKVAGEDSEDVQAAEETSETTEAAEKQSEEAVSAKAQTDKDAE